MSSRVYHLRVPAEAPCLKSVRAFVASTLQSAPAEEVENLVLALGEACTNIVQHRAKIPGHDEIGLVMEVEPTLVRFRFGCFCAKEDLPRIHPPDDARALRPAGRGMQFITQIMDRVAFEPDPTTPGAMNLVLEKRLRTGGPS